MRIETIALAGMLAGGLVFAAVQASRAHEAPSRLWDYPLSCCYGIGRGGDCDEIPATSVREGPNGYEVTLAPGDHPMVEGPMSFIYPYAKTQSAPDGRYHVCFKPDMSVRCFFAGERAF